LRRPVNPGSYALTGSEAEFASAYSLRSLRAALRWRPVLSTILAMQVALGLLIGLVEGWSVGDAMYFTFITGLTIGYGDIVPRQAIARALAIGIGVSGLLLTGVIAAIAVHAMRTALADSGDD